MMHFVMAMPLAVNLGVAGNMLAAQAESEPVPAGTDAPDPATTGSTELGNQGTFSTAEAPPQDETRATELEISAGGLYSTGNARLLAVTGLARFRLRRERHQFRAEAAGNYGRTAEDPDADPETTVLNVQGMSRYDFFFSKRWSAFLMGTVRHDRFQGLDLRLNIDPGVAFYAIQKPNHRLWFEAGYDFQYDVYSELGRDEAQQASIDEGNNGPLGIRPEKTLTNHAARAFVGYSNNLSEFVSFDTGVEYLQSVIEAPRFRLNWLNSLTMQVANRVSLGLSFQLRYENQPLPTVEKLDTVTAVLLGVRFI